VVTINTPLHPETEHMFNDRLIGMMKRGSYIVNTARGKIATATPSSARWKAGSLPAVRAMCGSRSRPGAPCRITA
jgi:formate dehydrogenase